MCSNSLSVVVQLSEDLVRLKERYERKMRDLMANTVGTVELQQLKHKQEQKVKEIDRLRVLSATYDAGFGGGASTV